MNVDYLVVGQGIAGSMIAWHALKAGKKIAVVDEGMGKESSLVSAGIVNPVTGQRMGITWMADTLIPFARRTYREIEKELGVEFMREVPIYRLITDQFSRNEWDVLRGEPFYEHYLGEPIPNAWEQLSANGGIGPVKDAFWVETAVLLTAIRQLIRSSALLLEEEFDFGKLSTGSAHCEYDNLKASQIVFCEGHRVHRDPFFNFLPLGFAKGELLTIQTDEPLPDAILNRHGFILPLGNNTYRVGATYNWADRNTEPTREGRATLEEIIKKIGKINFRVIAHDAGIRPTSRDRRPVIGAHPEFSNLFIFNGLGTMGISLAPFFSFHLLEHIEKGSPLLPAADIKRFLSPPYFFKRD